MKIYTVSSYSSNKFEFFSEDIEGESFVVSTLPTLKEAELEKKNLEYTEDKDSDTKYIIHELKITKEYL
jgi:hypothetical protein